MDVRDFLDNASSDQIARKIAELANSNDSHSIDYLADFLIVRDNHTYDKHVIPQLICRALLAKGKAGLNKMMDVYEKVDSSIYSKSIIESLWYAKNNMYPDLVFDSFMNIYPPLNQPLDQDVVNAAKDAIFDLVIDSQSNPDTFYELMMFLQSSTIKLAINEQKYLNFQQQFFSILSESTIKITKRIINKFSQLIDQELNEEEYQIFLKKNPVLLDPLGSSIIDKHKLGDDYITDFVLETLKGEFIIIEIEKPQDKIFTQSNDFTSKFIHAFGQVIDFIDWIENNIAYADKKLPGISSPRGLLIMGRSELLEGNKLNKFRRFKRNSNSIEILTYDDVLNRARSLYNNIRK